MNLVMPNLTSRDLPRAGRRAVPRKWRVASTIRIPNRKSQKNSSCELIEPVPKAPISEAVSTLNS